MVDIVYIAGKYKRTLFPGFNLIWPWEQIAHQVSTEEINWNCPPQKIQLSPEEDVILRAVISYQVVPEDAHLTVIQVKNWEESLRNLFVTMLQTVATYFTPADFLAWPESLQAYQAQFPYGAQGLADANNDFDSSLARRDRINTLLFQQMRDRVALWGIQIHWVQIRDIELAPHALASIAAPPAMPDYSTEQLPNVQNELVTTNVAQPHGLQAEAGNHVVGEPMGSQERTEMMSAAAFATPSHPLPPQKIPSEKAMKKAYQEVQDGKITDPQTIRQLATIFEAVARDPEASKKVEFDAERAAANLYEQANINEDMYRSGKVYSDTTRPDIHLS